MAQRIWIDDKKIKLMSLLYNINKELKGVKTSR
ncbi:hypothetical protein SCANT_v1c04130 [Spiroplasma cantharicola]|uniref:Uncharacterized protein n=1 Tax=Spiroplasma cantharicola TaxID=362837 RepID=A0A0M4JSG6_9MOLU|nr:hypothetical protein SCANT_v1c04130 [Spiroplasma cantharicola]